MSGTSSFPVIIGPEGPVPTDVDTLRAGLVQGIVALNPTITTNLPASMIEDIVSTGTGVLAQCDTARIETLDGLTPYGSNTYLLLELGQIFGIPLGLGYTTSVYVVFTNSTLPGFVIPQGLSVSDGAYSYVLQHGGILDTFGVSSPLFALATTQGSWAVPAHSVTQVNSSLPLGISLVVTNPLPGTAGTGAQTAEDYRAQVLQAQRAPSQGTSSELRTQLNRVPGVDPRLVSIQRESGWKIVVGGSGDPLLIAGAIFAGMLDTTTLVGSTVDSARNVTADVYDYPDIYPILFVLPIQQTVKVNLVWNTTSPYIVSAVAMAQEGSAAIKDYINSIPCGQPINIFALEHAFHGAVENLIDVKLITRITETVFINGVEVDPVAGTHAVYGDVEGYFTTDLSQITITQG